MASSVANKTNPISKGEFKNQVISDYIAAYKSRQTSLTGRKEVLTGKAKFGIFGDGKEVAQVAMARYMQNGDFRAGYYRDQTIMFALGLSDVQKFFAQLYAHPSTEHEPSSAGRSMNGHFGTRMLDDNGNWLPQTDRINISSDISPTAGQMPRALGLAFASKVYKSNKDLHKETKFSKEGNEISWATIGNAFPMVAQDISFPSLENLVSLCRSLLDLYTLEAKASPRALGICPAVGDMSEDMLMRSVCGSQLPLSSSIRVPK